MNMRILQICFVALSMLFLIACTSDSIFDGECKRDADCPQYERCDTRDYRCVCASDEACAMGEYCNPAGSFRFVRVAMPRGIARSEASATS